MDMTGSRRIEAPRARVWDALNDPEVLRASIPGCESVERTGPDSFQARVAVRIGPMAAKFGGKVTLSDVRPPEGYTITGEGQGGAMGFARGGADVRLEEEAAGVTLLSYAVRAQVGGKMAQLGARLVDSTARQMADQFFDRFAARVAPPAPAETAPQTGDGRADEAAIPAIPGTQRAAPVVGENVDRPPRPASTPSRVMDLFGRVPREPMGLPIVFWIGSAVMLAILALIFVLG